MKKKEKGFTMIELLAVISIIGILSAIAIGAVTQYLTSARDKDFEILEKNMQEATKNYFIEHPAEIPAIGATKTITAKTLKDQGYIDSLIDPERTNKDCNLDTSKVTVTRGGNASDYNMTLTYKVCIICSRRKSKSC